MLIIISLLCGVIISAILISIVDINIEKFLIKKGLDVNTHELLLCNFEVDGKDTKDYSHCIHKIHIIYFIIFTILSYIILPKFIM